MIGRAVEQQPTNSAAQVVAAVGFFGVRRQLSRLHGGKRLVVAMAGRPVRIDGAARRAATGGAPPQALPASLIAIGAECAKFLEKNGAKYGPVASRGGVASHGNANRPQRRARGAAAGEGVA